VSGDRYLVLFGGLNGSQIFGDTWEFGSSHAWSRISTSGPVPSPRYAAGLVYDSGDGYLLLFGGASASSVLGDTWSYQLGTWQSISTSPSPPARSSPGMAYDVADSLAVLFGGAGSVSSGPPLRHDSWVFSAGAWTNNTLGPNVPPPSQGPSLFGLGVLDVEILVVVLGVSVGAVVFAVVFVRRRRRIQPSRSETGGAPPRSDSVTRDGPPPQRGP